MKGIRVLLSAAVTIVAMSLSFAQGTWFDIGVKGAYGITMMANKNIFDDRQIDHRLSGGYGFGVTLGAHFAEDHGILVEYMRSTGGQKFDDERTATKQLIDYEWTTNDVLLLYRFSGNGGYFEIGPKVSFVSDIMRELEGTPMTDVSDFYEDKWYSGVLGFGTYIAGSEVFTIQAGIRLHYQFGDMVNESGQAAGFPVNETYESYDKTNLIMAQIHLEVNYAFGRFARRSCRDRWKLILF